MALAFNTHQNGQVRRRIIITFRRVRILTYLQRLRCSMPLKFKDNVKLKTNILPISSQHELQTTVQEYETHISGLEIAPALTHHILWRRKMGSVLFTSTFCSIHSSILVNAALWSSLADVAGCRE